MILPKENGISPQGIIPITSGEPITPFQIAKGILAVRQMPGEARSRYDQVRLDAIVLQGSLGHSFRDLLHTSFTLYGQGRGLPDVLDGVEAFYESGKSASLERAVNQPGTREFFKPEHVALLLTRSLYDEGARDEDGKPYNDENGRNFRVIELINRVRDYCVYAKDLSVTPPQISDKKIENLMEPLTGSDRLSMDNIGNALGGFNERLVEMMGTDSGVSLELVRALEWIDLKAGSVAFPLSFEDMVVGYSSEWFKQMMMFRELTGSIHDFDLDRFNRRIGGLKYLNGVNEKFDFVRSWTEDRLNRIKNALESYQDPENRVMVLGLIDQSIHLTITERKAATEAGERSRKYYADIRFKTGYHHPGD